MRQQRTFTLLPFVFGALFLAVIAYFMAQISVGMAMFLVILMVGLLALAGVVINLMPRSGKRKLRQPIKLKRGEFDAETQYTLTDDGELVEMTGQKPNR